MKILNSIKAKFTLGVFIIVTAVTVILGAVSYVYEKRAIENRVYAQLNSIADLKKDLVLSFLNERANDVKSLAASDNISTGLSVLGSRSGESATGKTAYRRIYDQLLSFKKIHIGYLKLELIDLSGSLIVSTENPPGRAPSRTRFQGALLRYADAFEPGTAVILQEGIGAGYLQFGAGVADKHGKIRCVVVSTVSLDDTLFPLFSDYSGLGRTGETILMKQNATWLSFVSPTRYSPLPINGYELYGDEYLKISRLAASGNEGIEIGIDHRGKSVIGAYRYIPALRWGMITKIDTDEAFARISSLRKRITLIAIVILAVVLVIVYFVVRRFSSPISDLILKTKSIAAGHYMVKVKSGRKDEIGELENNFNEMVVALHAARCQAGIKQEELENKVAERTEKLAGANTSLSEALQKIQRESEEKKVLHAQLLHAQKMEAVGTLAGGIAHDFNNILTAIMGYAHVMHMEMREDDPVREYLDQILSASESAATMTHSLLAFSRKQVINPQPINVNSVISRVRKLLARLLGEDIELRMSLCDSAAVVMADSGQMEQVLMNMATNARDAMPTGGQLTIETRLEEMDAQFIKAHGYGIAGKYAVISITDTGSGIDEQTRARIFEPFFTTKEMGRGTGLGLSITYGIVKQQNGYINCYSEPGLGTTFKIYLPFIESILDSRQAAATSSIRGGRETILVAEDNTDVRNLTRTILTEYGYSVIESVDGEDAVKKFNQHGKDPDLLLFDMIMPRKNGKEAYEEIKAARPGIKVIFTSGYTADIVRERAFIGQNTTVLTKPISPRDLLGKIREVLDCQA